MKFDSDVVVSPDFGLDVLSESCLISRLDCCVDGYRSVNGFLSDLDSVLVILNDLKRDTPTKKVLECLDSYVDLSGLGGSVCFSGLVATGSHSPPTDRELDSIVGGISGLEDRTFVHRAQDDSYVDVGVTSRGTPIKIDSFLSDFDGVICINSVEPHYFAGYTGGRKSIIPGVAHYKTIERNHEHALSSKAKVLHLDDNPVHLDMVEGCQMVIDQLKPVFLGINVVSDGERIFDLKSGTVMGSFHGVLDTAEALYSLEMDRRDKFDVVISKVGEPLNKNLYQSLKGFEHGRSLLKENGVLILVSKCSEGVGPSEFYKRLKKSGNPEKIMKEIEENYTLGSHKTYSLLEFLKKHEMYIVSSLPDNVIQNCFCKPASGIEETIKKIKKRYEKDPDILVINNSGKFVPKLKNYE
ncbi:Nickel-dependent lactate racemase [Methanonatronarchaeum thermophilum]|uniref:Nickel-dependent lactate racemase n=1 Tax=Methanonatronarchaeum thermophilum TaxID=1927129 RepID=A0A1Y3GD81_9EURY|nr:nickel-dependent lactate racemase [Methanonatronarchaeum thermophilum]OUJ19398.1 Nickel-dependent lactate racemase [Methanonatronarchaeum thermophilum]